VTEDGGQMLDARYTKINRRGRPSTSSGQAEDAEKIKPQISPILTDYIRQKTETDYFSGAQEELLTKRLGW